MSNYSLILTVCRNCLKSKRECAGYDPIFKPQNSGASSHYYTTNNAPSSRSTPLDSTPESAYAPIPHNFTPATSPQYGLHRTASYSPDSVSGQRRDYRPNGDPTSGANGYGAMTSAVAADTYMSRGGDGRDERNSYHSTTPEQAYQGIRKLSPKMTRTDQC